MHLQKAPAEILSRPNPDRSPALTEAEEQRILVDFNCTGADYRHDLCVHQLFEAQVERTPDATAVVCEEQRLTYRELNSRANRLGHYLRNRGAGPGSLVGICMQRSAEMLLSVLAALKAGAAYVPLDPEYPRGRLKVMIEDCSPVLLLTQQQAASELSLGAGELVCVDSAWQEIAKHSEENPGSAVTPENLVYVIYTSGSSGRPKGVCLPHRALTNLLFWQLENSYLPAGSRTLQFTSLSFDVSFQEIFSTLCGGGCLVLVSDSLRRDARRLLRFLREENIARLFLPFVALQHLAEAASEEKNLPLGMREVITAGEQLKITRQVASFFARMPQCSLHNHYGPSETHVVTAFQLAGSPDRWPAVPPIGKPIANVQTYILDPHLNPVPIRASGELYIGGVALAQGYLHQPELTAERFIPNPFSAEPNAKLYKTGDIARYLADGQIEFQGRADNQVKIRGYRVELGEIECALGKHLAVQDCVVTAREDTPGNRRLVGYIVVRKGKDLDNPELRSFLKQSLPEYMVPSVLMKLDAFPLTPSGKVDRRALPAPDWSRTASTPGETAYVTPRNATEQKLEEIWSKALNIPRVSIRDNFFDMGGHSLLAVGLITEIATTFGKELSFNTLLQAPTIEQLALYLAASSRIAPRHSIIPIQPLGSKPPLFYVPGGRAVSALPFRETSLLLGSDQPVYGVESRLPGEREAFESVSVRSEHYLALIRSVQARGPYYLVGYCLGGLVAYEMAQKLRAQGERVAFLALVECSVPERPRSLFQRLRLKAQRALRAREEEVGSETEMPDPTQLKNQEVMEKYRPRALSGKIHLFLAEDYVEARGANPTLDPRRAWSKLVDSYEVRVVPGDHFSMLDRPNVLVLAQELRLLLEAAQRDALEPLA
jgi:amino acid adenylation domain-containing protein